MGRSLQEWGDTGYHTKNPINDVSVGRSSSFPRWQNPNWPIKMKKSGVCCPNSLHSHRTSCKSTAWNYFCGVVHTPQPSTQAKKHIWRQKKKKKLNHFDLKVYGNFKLLLKDVFFILKFYFIIETYFFSLFISCLSIIIYYWIATTFHPLPPSPIIIIIYHIYYEVFYIFLFWKIPLLMLIINLNGNLIFSPFNFYIINPFIKVLI